MCRSVVRFFFVSLRFFPISCLVIPRIIHQIWLPDKRQAPLSTLTCKHVHTNLVGSDGTKWRYILWDLSNIERNSSTEFNIRDFRSRDYFDRWFLPSAKADILRYEILWQFGGIYLDADFVCLRPFDALVESFAASPQECFTGPLFQLCFDAKSFFSYHTSVKRRVQF
jgi:mannosyltransferase OCH1-like enzyme